MIVAEAKIAGASERVEILLRNVAINVTVEIVTIEGFVIERIATEGIWATRFNCFRSIYAALFRIF